MHTHAGSVDTDYRAVFRGQQTVSNNPHRWPPSKKDRLNGEDIGGGFFLQSAEWWKLGGASFYVSRPQLNRADWGITYPWYNGGLPVLDDAPIRVADNVLNAFGTTAISRTLPTAPLSGVGQFIGELRDLPKFAVETWKNRTKGFMALAKGGSKDYLNVQFGWIPFVNDIMSFAKVSSSSARHIQQFLRDSGRTVRRRTSPETTTTKSSSVVTTSFSGVPAIQTWLVEKPGVVTRTVETTTEKWFSGAYRYYVPTDGELLDPKTGQVKLDKVVRQSEQLSNRLYGTRITPHLIWQLAPWSWAIDWVTNAGDVVKNLTYFNSDNLVLKYGYVMCRQTRYVTYEVTKPCILYGGSAVQSTQQIRYRTLQRNRATPYGFGLDPGTFSARQWSIIAALGISKAPYSLNF